MGISRSKSPLRIGLAGGGTDLRSYYSIHGGEVLNATINLFAHCSIEELKVNKVIFEASDIGLFEEFNIPNDNLAYSKLKLHFGVYYRLMNEYFNGNYLPLKIQTYADVPQGSGLGTSSALVVAIIKAFVELFKIPLGDYDIADLAYQIERNDLGLSGGKQDQYSSTFGGFNYIEFFNDEKVIVNPLRIKNWIKNELEESIVLFFTGASRESSKIIDQQVKETVNQSSNHLSAMHELKEAAKNMKKSLLVGNIDGIINQIRIGWEAKKKTSSLISNTHLNSIYNYALSNGALAGKISGAGGGGFFMFFVNPINRSKLISSLSKLDGKVQSFEFVEKGALGWYIL
jgi:D-glycero-alpha-D-manno-heptose-7-phosphate kinase